MPAETFAQYVARRRQDTNASLDDLAWDYRNTFGVEPDMGGTAGPDTGGDFPVALPGAEEAKTRLRGLQTGGVDRLFALMDKDPSARRQAIEDALYEEQAADINEALDRERQRGLETLFGRGVGESSITGDYVLGPIARERASRLASARRNAFAQAGSEVRADTATQLQMLGQAFNQGTAGLQGEANVEQATAARQAAVAEAAKNRAQAVSEAGLSRTQQESQFGRSLGQQKELQERAFTTAEKIASENRLAGGIGAGIGGLATLFSPAANNFLMRRLPDLFGPVA